MVFTQNVIALGLVVCIDVDSPLNEFHEFAFEIDYRIFLQQTVGSFRSI